MCITNLELQTVYIYPGDEQYSKPQPDRPSNYVVRRSSHCLKCGELLQLSYDEPTAVCSCGCQEWHY